MPIITLTTDFGEGSHYVAAMKGAILSVNPQATLVDLTHSVPPQDVQTGARTLFDTTPWFPKATIHLAVVDPGVGSERPIVYAEIGNQRYLAPDNGLLTSLAARQTPRKIVGVDDPAFWLPRISSTFHGRDILAPVAGHLSSGVPPEQLGNLQTNLVLLEENRGRRVGRRIEGEVVEVDSFGNLLTNITTEMLEDAPRDESVTISCEQHETIGIFKTYSDQPEMTLIALVGSTDRLELAIVNDSASAMLGVAAGAPVVVQW